MRDNMWNLKEHSWPIALSIMATSVFWFLRDHPIVPFSGLLGDHSMLMLAVVPLVYAIFCAIHLWVGPRLALRRNQWIEQFVRESQARAAALNERERHLEDREHEIDSKVSHLREVATEILGAAEREAREGASQITSQAKQEVQEIKDLTEKEARKIKDSAEKEAQDVKAQVLQLKAQNEKEVKEIRQEVEVALLKAEAAAEEILERAQQGARSIISQARAQTRDLWSWCEAKAKDARVTPDEWKEVQKVRNEARKVLEEVKKAAEIIGRAQDRAAGLEQTFQHLGELEEIMIQAGKAGNDQQENEIPPPDEKGTADISNLKNFISNCCVLGPESFAQSSDLHQAYVYWVNRNAITFQLSPNAFAAALKLLGFERTKTNKCNIWKGIGIAVEAGWKHPSVKVEPVEPVEPEAKLS